MSGIAKKRTYPKNPTVGAIKIVKLQDKKYAVQTKVEEDEVKSNDNHTHTHESDSRSDWMLPTPTLNLFDNLPYGENGFEAQEPLELKICSVTSLNPEYDTEGGSTNKRLSLRNFNRNRSSADGARLSPQLSSESGDGGSGGGGGGAAGVTKNGISPPRQEYLKLGIETANELDRMLGRGARDRETGDVESGGERDVSRGKGRRGTLLAIYADDGTRYFPCLRCSSAFIKKSLLYKHVLNKHPEFLVCKLCCGLFRKKTTKSLEHHMKAHNIRQKDQTKQCQYCLFWFTTKVYPKHIQIHSAIKNYVCHVCKNKFRRIDNMKKHMELRHGIFE